MKLIAEARIRNGKMEFKQRSVFLSDIERLKDGDYVVSVERKKKKRSIDQNKYYWGVVVPMVKHGLLDIGYRITTEGTHEYLKSEFNIKEIVNERTGEILKTIGSTTEMSTVDMLNYFDTIRQWSSEYLGVYIPEPSEQLRIEV